MDRTLTLLFYLLADSSVDPSPCGSADESFITSLSSLPTCQQYHLVHISTEDLTDIHSGDSPTNPSPIVINRKRSSPTGSACSNTSREGDNSPTGSAGKCYITLAAVGLDYKLSLNKVMNKVMAGGGGRKEGGVWVTIPSH